MRLRILMVAVSVLLLSSPAWAESNIFGGYSFLSLDFGGTSRETVNGWAANANFAIADSIGVVGDVSGFYENGGNIHTYMGGIRYTASADSVSPFAQALFGGARLGGGGVSENGFAMAFGGGVDVPVGDTIAIRVVEFDWVPVRFSGEWFTDPFRLAFGVVLNVD